MMTTALFTTEDLTLINEKIRPKNRKTFIVFSLGSLCLCFLFPFLPGKHTYDQSAYNEGIYWHAFFFYLIVFSAMMALIYYRFISSLSQDLRDGEKIVARLSVKIKNTSNLDGRFKLIFDRGRLLHTPKIILPGSEISNWQEGDLVDLELLYKSGEILNYKKVSQ